MRLPSVRGAGSVVRVLELMAGSAEADGFVAVETGALERETHAYGLVLRSHGMQF